MCEQEAAFSNRQDRNTHSPGFSSFSEQFSFQSLFSAPCLRSTFDSQEKTFTWWRWKMVVHLIPLSSCTSVPSTNVHWSWDWTRSPSGLKTTLTVDCSHEIKRCLLLGRKAMTNPDGILKSRDITLLTRKSSNNIQTHTYAHTQTFLQLTFRWCRLHLKVTKFVSNLKVLKISS